MLDKGPTNSVYRPNEVMHKQTALAARTTIVLALLLIMCLGAAWWMVYSRSGRERMRLKGAEIIEQVSKRKLTYYFKGEVFGRMYLIESEKGVVGFDVLYQEPIWDQGDQVSYRIREYFFMTDIGRQRESDCFIRDDMRIWTSSEVRIESGLKLEQAFSYKDGVLTANSNYSPGYLIPLADQLVPMNLVPPPLFDLFVRLGQEANSTDGIEFTYPIMEPAGFKRGRVSLQPFEVIANGDIPKDLENYPGHPQIATVRWIGADESMPREQIRIVDDQYQMLWSREMYLGLVTLRKTGRWELANSLPMASQMIQRWLVQKGIDPELFWNIVDG